MNRQRWVAIMGAGDRCPGTVIVRSGLSVLAGGYRAIVAGRNTLFDCGLRGGHRLPRPVISIGNITTGGTGKTPIVIELARRLRRVGCQPAILLRGYRGDCDRLPIDPNYTGPPVPRCRRSDELNLYSQCFGDDVPVAADPDRARSAAYLLHEHPGIDVFLLDDGFQHRQVHRDLDVVLIDATEPFGFGRLLPRGLLREPVENLARADAVIVTRADQVGAQDLADLDARITALTGRPPRAHAAHRWTCYRDDLDRQVPLDDLANRNLLGVCGVGNPEAFAASLEQYCGRETHQMTFADHHRYTLDDLHGVFSRADRCQVDAVVTTDKDWTSWKPLLTNNYPVPVYRPVLTIDFLLGGDELVSTLDAVARRTA